jgi:hypothetical protein
VPPLAREAVEGLDLDRLHTQPAPGANTIAWLIWHVGRIQDAQIAELVERPQIWESGTCAARFGLDPDPSNHGYGHTADEMLAVRPESVDALLEYLDAADAQTQSMLRDLSPADLDGIVDHNWDPPVTLGVRLISIADDCLQHVGQAAYVRGLLHD